MSASSGTEPYSSPGEKAGMTAPGPVIEPAGDRPPGSEKLHPGFAGIVGKFLLRDFIMGFLPALDFDGLDAVDRDADVIARAQLEDDMERVGRLGTGQDDADIGAVGRDDFRVAPDLAWKLRRTSRARPR